MKKKGIFLCVGFLVAFTMVASDLALAQEPKEIVIGSTLALSGRFKGIVGEFDKLAKAWTDLTNERGGIYVKEYDKKLPIRIKIYSALTGWIRKRAPETFIYLCMESPEVWKKAIGVAPGNNTTLKSWLDERCRI